MILASGKSDGISTTGDVYEAWKTEEFSRLRFEEPFAREDRDCFFTVLFPAFANRSGDPEANRTEVADNSFCNRIFWNCFGETIFLNGSGEVDLKSIDVGFGGLEDGTVLFFRERRGELSCSLLLHVQSVWVPLVRVNRRVLCFLVLGENVFVREDFRIIVAWLHLLLRTCKYNSVWK